MSATGGDGDAGVDRGAALREQRRRLLGEIERLTSQLATVEDAIDAHDEGRATSDEAILDWAAVKAEGEAIDRRYAEAMAAGEPPHGPAAMDAAEAHRAHISRHFYDCSPEMHRGLGETYVADRRFAQHYDRLADGLAVYVRDAIAANADRQAH